MNSTGHTIKYFCPIASLKHMKTSSHEFHPIVFASDYE